MKNSKKVLSFIAVLFLCSSMFAHQGYMNGENDVRIVSTKYFDIIFTPASASSAYELKEQVDNIFLDICKDMNMEPWFRLPVVLTRQTDVFNAYFTNGYYNHIVLFDAIPTENMLVFDENIINTFKHELTHAVTMNNESKTVQKLTSLFGDIYNLGPMIYVPRFMSEGASVAYESKTGQGRLNDQWYMHMSQQAKLMNKFPDWSEVKGARDIFPAGSDAYGFGGPFTQYIQQKYGMEKYAQFWYGCVNFESLTTKGAFKKVYNITLDQAWSDFKESVFVPDVDPNPLATDGIIDIFKNTNINNHMGIYEKVVACENGVAMLDTSSRTVYWSDLLPSGEFGKPRKLFSRSYTYDINVSSDGKFMAVCCYDMNHASTKTEVFIYSMESKSWYNLKETGLRSAAVIKTDNGYFLAAAGTDSQVMSLKVFSLQVDKKKTVKNASFVSEVFFNSGDIISSVIDSGNGEISAIYKEGLVWSIRSWTGLLSESSEIVYETKYSLPEGLRIRNLSCSIKDGEKTFAFAYVLPEIFPRLGMLKAGDRPLISLMNTDVSGGIYSSAAVNDNKFLYASYLYDEYKVFELDANVISFKSENSSIEKATLVPMDPLAQQKDSIDLQAFLDSSEKYKKGVFYRSAWIPLSNVTRYNINYVRTSLIEKDTDLGLGITWVGKDPWDAATVMVSGEYDFSAKKAGLSTTFAGGTDSDLFKYEDKTNLVLNFTPSVFQQASNSLLMQSSIDFGRFSSFILTESNLTFVGKSIWSWEEVDPINHSYGNYYDFDQTNYLFNKNAISLTYSNIHKTGSNVFGTGGFSLGLSFNTEYLTCLEDSPNSVLNKLSTFKNNPLWYNIGMSANIHIPRLLPFDCGRHFTYNLPLRLSGVVMDRVERLYNLSAEVCLFEWEIQAGTGLIPLYLNRFYVTADINDIGYYDSNSMDFLNIYNIIKNDSVIYCTTAGLHAMVNSSLNFGSYTGVNFTIGAGVLYNIRDGFINLENPWKFDLTTKILF